MKCTRAYKLSQPEPRCLWEWGGGFAGEMVRHPDIARRVERIAPLSEGIGKRIIFQDARARVGMGAGDQIIKSRKADVIRTQQKFDVLKRLNS